MKFTCLLFISVAFFSCTSTAPPVTQVSQQVILNPDSLKHELIRADLAFSELSKNKGRNLAFINFAADSGTLLRPYSIPIVGKDSIQKKFYSGPDDDITFVRTPLYADVSQSGDLGYTYGTYKMTIKQPIGVPEIREGTYVSIWKKDSSGKWKYVLDTGNPGLKEPK